MATLTRRQTVQCSFLSVGAIAMGPSLIFPRLGPDFPVHAPGTTYDSTIERKGWFGYRRLGEDRPYPLVVRSDLAAAGKSRAARRMPKATVVQLTDLHFVDVQNPLRFEFLDHRTGTGHRPQELLGPFGATALVQKINQLQVGPLTGRSIDAVMTTGDNTDNQSGTELECLLSVLAGGTVRPDSGGDHFEGVAGSGLWEYWQPESTAMDRYKDAGFPTIPGLLAAAMRSFVSPGLAVPWLLTMGNHDDTVLGTLATRPYVEDWTAGGRKIFSARCDETLFLAELASRPAALSDPQPEPREVADLLETVAALGETRTVVPDERRRPFTGSEYVDALRSERFTGAGPVGHGYGPEADGSRLYYRYWLSPDVLAISLDTTNQAGGADGSVGAAQLEWLERTLLEHADEYVLVFSHHPSYCMDNLAPDPRSPEESRHSGDEVLDLLHRHPNVLAWINGHCHRNKISARRHADPRRSFWEINTASHVDAPQQARVIEVASNGDGTVSLFTTMLDADAPLRPSYDDLTPENLAGIFREVAYNDLTFRDRRGSVEDRNTELLLADPL
ncbi:MAG TPA: TIGR03767 family metallophosphoesterase [Nocardioidaceae bacterium]|nr:TIGR03767 family metallophosphoesterase [Nocardioidaceae bacterium]